MKNITASFPPVAGVNRSCGIDILDLAFKLRLLEKDVKKAREKEILCQDQTKIKRQ